MSTLYLAAREDATDYPDLGTDTVANSFLRLVSFGAYDSGGGDVHFDIRNIKVGTTAYGSTDLFAPVLADLSEFDGIFGNDGSIVASGGVLSVDGSGDHYGYKQFASDQTVTVYEQFDIRARAGDASPFSEDYSDVWDDAAEAATDGDNVNGIFSPPGIWEWFNGGTDFGGGTVVGNWITLGLRYSFLPPPVPVPATHICS